VSGEIPLSGGFVNDVARMRDTVHRPVAARGAFVHQLLGYLEERGWRGAPRFLGIDAQGREILTYLDGHVAWHETQPSAIWADDCLVAVADLLREFHDLTAGSALAAGHEVVCHNDLSPKNTVYRDVPGGYRPVAFIDWDIAAPGDRINDVAHMCWQYLGLGPGLADPVDAGRRVRMLCDAYGLDDRGSLVETILWWQDRCWRGMELAAAAGDPAMTRLCDAGAPAQVRAACRWVADHRAELEAALGRR